MSTNAFDSSPPTQPLCRAFSRTEWMLGLVALVVCVGLAAVEMRYRIISPYLAGARTSQLQVAVMQHPRDIPILVRYGRDPNGMKSGMSPLEQAVHFKRMASVAALLQNGADPNLPSRSGQLPLEFLCTFGRLPNHYEMASMLLRAGADPNRSQRGKTTPLILACRGSVNPNLVKLLLDYGADPTAADERGRTALHEAATWADDATVQRLLELGADPLALDHSGHAPFQWPARQKLLLEFAARKGRLPDPMPRTLSHKQRDELIALAVSARADQKSPVIGDFP